MTAHKYLFAVALFGISAFISSCSEEKKEISGVVPESLPFQKLSLSDFSEFEGGVENWEIAGKVLATPEGFSSQPGKGILVKPGKTKGQLTSGFEHGDMDLTLDFVISGATNFTIVLQERYPVVISAFTGRQPASISGGGVLLDQAGLTDTTVVDPLKAPGLWQTLQLSFKAPRFDENGKKTENAILEELYLNGFLVQSKVEIESPAYQNASSEIVTAPFLLIADNAGLAVRNISYKNYGLEKLSLAGLEYAMYTGTWDKLPDFSQMDPVKSGEAEELTIRGLSDGNDHYGIIFKGKLTVPVTGKYLFSTFIDDGGELFIDNELVVHNDGEPGGGAARGMVDLEEGEHDFEMSYYQDVWGSVMVVFYEGPGISRKSLGAPLPQRGNRDAEPILLIPDDSPIAIRSFLKYKDTTKTHPLSVISSSKINYTYDLLNGALIKGWKGAYADANQMWRNRGESQLLNPLNFSVDFSDKVPVARLLTSNEPWPEQPQEGFKVLGYQLNEEGYPIINYQMGNLLFEDLTLPSKEQKGLTREVSFKNPDPNALNWFHIVSGNEIYLMPNGWYCVDGDYFVIVDEQPGVNITNRFGNQLVVQLPSGPEKSVLKYSIVW